MNGALKTAPLPKPTATEGEFREKTALIQNVAIWGSAGPKFEAPKQEAAASAWWAKFGANALAVNKFGDTRTAYAELDKWAVKARKLEPYEAEYIANQAGTKAAAVLGTVGKALAEAASGASRLDIVFKENVLSRHAEDTAVEVGELRGKKLVLEKKGDIFLQKEKEGLTRFDANYNPALNDIKDVFTGAGEMNERIEKTFKNLKAAHEEYRAAAAELMASREVHMEKFLRNPDQGLEDITSLKNAGDRFKKATTALNIAIFAVLPKNEKTGELENSELVVAFKESVQRSEKLAGDMTKAIVVGAAGGALIEKAAKGAGQLKTIISNLKSAREGGAVAGAETGAALESTAAVTADSGAGIWLVGRGLQAERGLAAGARLEGNVGALESGIVRAGKGVETVEKANAAADSINEFASEFSIVETPAAKSKETGITPQMAQQIAHDISKAEQELLHKSDEWCKTWLPQAWEEGIAPVNPQSTQK